MHSHLQSPREVVAFYYQQVWAERRPELIPSLFADGYSNHAGARGTLSGPSGIENNYHATLSAFPDVEMRVEKLLAEGEFVTAHYLMLGSHQGDFQGISATGSAINVPGIGIYRVQNGQIQESWVVRDSLLLLRQLGAA
ncbi:hypothetical protein BTJ39_02455 [Izhakiella australiensis]|uniref:Ester cyclase n=1 Tax=Izhakiella australiensis TaxID=1926881 RepID=A0A1S8YT71_9GAMM|nr:ester cyclase [Izhakiella australiensis]OON42036.1 hypothetical protein BTJ39_02455 [Izhakiella australiensis]